MNWLTTLIAAIVVGFSVGCAATILVGAVRAGQRRRRLRALLEADRAAWCAEMLARMVQES